MWLTQSEMLKMVDAQRKLEVEISEETWATVEEVRAMQQAHFFPKN